MSSNDIDYFDEGFDDEKEKKYLSNINIMSSYKIKQYTRDQAKKHGVIVKVSTNPKKKIDVFKKVKEKDGKEVLKKLVSVGDPNYNDYPTYQLLEKKKEVKEGTAEARRKLYKKRHRKDRKKPRSAGWYADKLLW